MPPRLFFVCLLTFVHYAAAQMRSPIVPLYATEHGATATGVGIIVAAHMSTAAAGSIPFGRAADVWGRRPLILCGMALGIATSALLPLAEQVWALAAIYGVAGIGIAAFSPSILSLVGDVAAPGKTGRAFAWYSTAHYGAIGIGPFLAGVLAERSGYGVAFAGSALGITVAFLIGLMMLRSGWTAASPPVVHPSWSVIKGNPQVWAGWTLAVSGLFVQGVVFTFLPLLAQGRGFGPATIGLVFLVLGLANTVARIPAGSMIDRTGRCAPYAFTGVGLACALTLAIPRVHGETALLALAGLFGAVSGSAFVAVSVGLSTAAPATARGLVMGGYSTALYLGLGLGSLTVGPIITRTGYDNGFVIGGALGGLGVLIAFALYRRSRSDVSRC